MNARTVLRLARKDISLLRWPFLLYVVLGAVAVGLSGIDERAVRSLGLTLAANVLIATCFHLVLSNVLGERRDRTLAFTLSLPVSPREIVAGKLVSSVAMYLACGILATTALVHLAPVDVFAPASPSFSRRRSFPNRTDGPWRRRWGSSSSSATGSFCSVPGSASSPDMRAICARAVRPSIGR
jgi:hypothetical protein